MLAPHFFSCYRISEICIVGGKWDFIFLGHILMLAPLCNSPVPDFYAQGKSGKEFQEWRVGLWMECGGNQMSIFGMKGWKRTSLSAWMCKKWKTLSQPELPTGVIIKLCLWSKYDWRFFWSEMPCVMCGAGPCVPACVKFMN